MTTLIAARPVDGCNSMLALRTLRELGAGSAAPEPLRDAERLSGAYRRRIEKRIRAGNTGPT
ncbi:hypothetical protein [Streptomyces sp. NPDC020607]|uniref:hypothetical protein n=1 Tax=Streptomyces sp. NPDC020607 TaxID=3365082 RepID=UPI00379DBA7F